MTSCMSWLSCVRCVPSRPFLAPRLSSLSLCQRTSCTDALPLSLVSARGSQSMQMSGRLLRRLPVLAHARHIGMSASAGSSSSSSSGGKPSMETWLEAMEKCVVEEGEQLGKVMEGCM